MTHEISHRRRRATVSLSMPATGSDPIEVLDRVVETFHQVNRALPTTALGHQELIALAGLLAQISGALLALTDQLSAPTHRYDRIQQRHAPHGASGESGRIAIISALENCRDGLRATYAAALAFHTDLMRHSCSLRS